MTKIIIGPAYPLRGGIADFNQALASSYNSKNNHVIVFTFSLQYPKLLFPGKTQYANDKPSDYLDIKIEINSINPINWIRTARKIASYNPEYIIIPYWTPFMSPCLSTIARQVKKRTKAKTIAIMHNVIPHESFPLGKLLTKYFIKSCDGFIALSKSVLSELDQFTKSQNKKFSPHPIYNIYGDKVSKKDALNYLQLDSNKKYILFFGIIRHYKGLDLLLESLSYDQIISKDIHLIVAGEFYDDKKYYIDLIEKYNLKDRVILTNKFIANNEVKYFFSACDLVAQTYKNASQSGVTQIAYHFERPMLVTNVGGLSEIVPNNKVGYVTEKDPKEIAAAIADFYNNNREEEFSKNTSLEKKRFSWDKLIQNIEELIH